MEHTDPTPDGLPSVSVIVPCYHLGDRSDPKRADRLVTALASQDIETELLFVDDGSGDGTGDVLRALTEALPNTRVLVHEQNRGRAAARNTGIEAANGEILLFLDADMAPEPGFVRAHAEAHRQTGVVGVVSTPRLRGLDPDDPYHQYLRWRRAATVQGDGPVPFRQFIVGYTSVQADAVRAVGSFDERFTYGEDIDFAYRLARRYPGGLVRSSTAVVEHYEHGDLDERLAKLREFGRDNLPLLLAKHPGLAEEANLNFAEPSTLGAWARRLALGIMPSRAVRHALPRIPAPLRLVALRYLMAATVATAHREVRTERPSP